MAAEVDYNGARRLLLMVADGFYDIGLPWHRFSVERTLHGEGTRHELTLWSIVTAAVLSAIPLFLPSLLLSFDGASLLGRAAICLAVISPAGILLGYGFPTGMRLAALVDNRPTPWFWGINGAAAVQASAFSVAVSIAFGIYVTLLVGAACYILLVPAGLAIMGRIGDAEITSTLQVSPHKSIAT